MGIRDTLKSYFTTGSTPTQEQFAELIDNLATTEEVERIDFDAKFALLSPPITQQPVGGLITSGSTYTVTVVAGPQVGKSPTQIQWQQQQSGSNWLNISGATSASYTTPTLTDTRTLRASLKNDFGTSYSDIVTVSVLGFSTQPTSGGFYVGNNVTLTAVANLANASYQWQEYDGSVWQNIADATAETLAISNLQLGDDGREFRCVASLSGVQSISSVAEITVFGISTQPTEEVTLEGVADTYAVVVNQPTATYQWQRSTDGGATWSDLAAETDSSLAVSGTQANNGRKYRCIVSFRGLSVTSNVVTRHVLFVATQPASIEVFEGQAAAFSVLSSVAGSAYQWQRSTDGGATWSDLAAEIDNTYTITATVRAQDNNSVYRSVITNGLLEIETNSATLNVWNPSVLSGKHFFASAMRNMFVERGAQTTPSGVSDPVGSWVADYPNTEILSAAADANRGTRMSQGILFDGADDYYRSTSEHLRDFTRSQNSVWVWANVTKPSHGTNRIIFSIAGSLAGYSVFNLRFSATGVLQLVIRNVYTDTSQLINLQDLSSIATNTPISIGLHVDYQNGKVQAVVNKITLAEQNLGFSGAAADVRAVNCTFGATSETALNGQFSGVIGDLCLIRGSLPGIDLTKMTNYMATRMGIV